ncbi:hypothetical protein ABIA43_005711 [Bradyrhizobium sp. USDA 328]
MGLDRRGAATERAGIHIIVTAIVDMTHEPRLRPGFQLLDEAAGGDGADGGNVGPDA